MQKVRQIQAALDAVTTVMWRSVTLLMTRGETMQSLEQKSAVLEESSRLFYVEVPHPPPPPLHVRALKCIFRWTDACCLPWRLLFRLGRETTTTDG